MTRLRPFAGRITKKSVKRHRNFTFSARFSLAHRERDEGAINYRSSTVPSDSGGLSGFRGCDRDGRVSQRHGLPGSRVSAMRQQPGHRVSRFLRFGPYYRGRHRLLPSLSYQPGQRGHTDSRQSRRHHLVGPSLMDLYYTLRVDRQAGLGGTPRHSLLRPRHTPLGVDRQEEQVYQRCALLRLDTSHGCHVDQQVREISRKYLESRYVYKQYIAELLLC